MLLARQAPPALRVPWALPVPLAPPARRVLWALPVPLDPPVRRGPLARLVPLDPRLQAYMHNYFSGKEKLPLQNLLPYGILPTARLVKITGNRQKIAAVSVQFAADIKRGGNLSYEETNH